MKNKQVKLRDLLTTVVFVLILGGFFVLHLVLTPPEVSLSERRPLKTLPTLSTETLVTAEFMGSFEDYAADSFPFRDELRTVRAFSVLDIFRLSDKSGLYYDKAVGAGKIEKLSEAEARKSAEKIRTMAQGLDGLSVYWSFVPDKSIYASKNLPGFDPDTTREVMGEVLSDYTFVDITGALTADDFYRTDLHWNQTKLAAVTDALSREMGFVSPAAVPRIETAGDFQGVYTGQLSLPLAPDKLTYYTGGAFADLTVKYANEQTFQLETGELYDVEAFAGRDPYDIFLRGAQPFIVIENPNSTTDKELYLFRDSFSSSLAPILATSYSKVTL
ncbi:MAG: hypothetical protein LBN40_06495, partial [Oscillospiraceae bacterium]|nr:hypothetical protein [Oscillospiraceae bacterium]